MTCSGCFSRSVRTSRRLLPGSAAQGGDYPYPDRRPHKPLSNMAMDMQLRRMGREEPVHGFRSSFRDRAGEMTAFPRDLADQALAHTVGDATERAYRRGDALDRRRKLKEAWTGYLGQSRGGAVVDFRRA